MFIFDFDGVIADSIDIYEGTVRRCLDAIGQPILRNRDDFLALFDDNFYDSLVTRGVNLEAFMEASVEILAGVRHETIPLYDGIIPVLAQLRPLSLMVIVSSSGNEEIRAILDRHCAGEYFQAILGSENHLGKTEKIRRVMTRTGIGRERTYYIGDTTGDIREARAAGVKTVGVTWGWHTRERLLAVNPDFLIDFPEELLTL